MSEATNDRSPPASWCYTDSGSGDAIVLVHGLGTDSSAWDPVVALLQDQHRVISVDVPGYSLRSIVPDVPQATELADGLNDLLAKLGVESAVLVGHSFGGAISLITAHRHSDRVAGLVLVAPGGFGAELNPFLPLLGSRFGAGLLRTLYRPRAAHAIERIAARIESRPSADSRLRIAELMEIYDRLRTEPARAQFQASVRLSLALNADPERRRFADIDAGIPILIVWGREDRVLPAWHANNAVAVLPWAVVHVVDGAGHTPHRSHPARTAQEIGAFVASDAVRRRLSPPGS